MKKSAYFKTERQAQAACKSLKNAGISDFELNHNYSEDTLRYVTENNPSGLYFGTGTVSVPGIGLVSGVRFENEKTVGLGSYSSFLNVSGTPEGVMINVECTPESEGIIAKHGGYFLDF